MCCCCLVCGAGLASDLFSNRRSVRSCLACLVPQCTAALQESRDSTRLSHYWTLIDAIFRSILQVSWNCSLGSFTSLEDATILHSSNMAQLTEMALTRERQDGGRSGALKHVHVGDLVLPSYAECADGNCSVSSREQRMMSKFHWSRGVCSRRRLCTPSSWCSPSGCCWTTPFVELRHDC